MKKLRNNIDSKMSASVVLLLTMGTNSYCPKNYEPVYNNNYMLSDAVILSNEVSQANNNDLSGIIDNLTNSKIQDELIMSEYLNKRNIILGDVKLSSKIKGRLIYKLNKKYFSKVKFDQEKLYLNEFKSLEKMRPEV